MRKLIILLTLLSFSMLGIGQVKTDDILIVKKLNPKEQGPDSVFFAIQYQDDETGNYTERGVYIGDSLKLVEFLSGIAGQQLDQLSAAQLIVDNQARVLQGVAKADNILKNFTGKSLYDELNRMFSGNYLGNWAIITNGRRVKGEIKQAANGAYRFFPENNTVYSSPLTLRFSNRQIIVTNYPGKTGLLFLNQYEKGDFRSSKDDLGPDSRPLVIMRKIE